MKVLHNASIIILLIDIFRKHPIHEAIIFCNGHINSHIKKDSGHFILCDLDPGTYKIKILSTGYVKKEFSVTLSLGDCKRFIFEMSAISKSPKILNIPRFEFLIKNKDGIIKEKDLKIILRSSISFLKLVQKSKKGDQGIVLNIPDDNSLLLQNYLYMVKSKDNDSNSDNSKNSNSTDENSEVQNGSQNKDEKEELPKDNVKEPIDKEDSVGGSGTNLSPEAVSLEFFISGYDTNQKVYILSSDIKNDLPIGGSFCLFWNVKTDKFGKVLIPYFRRFMKSDFLDFEFIVNGQSKKIDVNLKKFNLDLRVLKADVVYE